jgi:hypothetical protein
MKVLVSSLLAPRITTSTLTKSNDSLNTKGWIGNKSCLVIITRTSMSIARPNITTGLPDRQQTWPYILQMASGKTLPVLMETLLKLALEWHLVQTWVSTAKITDKFILGLEVLHAHDVSIYFEGHVL